MHFDTRTLNTTLKEVSSKWDLSGHTCIIQDQTLIGHYDYGYKDRDQGIAMEKQGKYLFQLESHFFIGLGILCLIQDKVICFKDTIDAYLPEYPYGNKITIENLLKSNSGIPDFFRNKLMVDLQTNESYLALSDQEKIIFEKNYFHQHRSFKDVFEIIKDMPLDYQPGTEDQDHSDTNTVFLAEIIRRMTMDSVFKYLSDKIFLPLKMDSIKEGLHTDMVSYKNFRDEKLIRMPMDKAIFDVCTWTPNDLHQLLKALANKELFSFRMWKKILKLDSEGDGIIFSKVNGLYCANTTFLGFGCFIYFNQKKALGFASLANEEQMIKREDGSWQFFRKDFRDKVSQLMTYPEDTKMLALKKDYFWDVLAIKISKDQHQFVLDVKSSVAMALMYKTKKAFVQMEDKVIVGLLVLDIDPKKNIYNIDIIIIDEKYQNRGYGKLMVQWAVDYLKEKGAKKLTIGVSRANPSAIKVYKNAGFKPKSINEGGMDLSLDC